MKTSRQAWADFRTTNNLPQDSEQQEWFESGYCYLIAELMEKQKAEMKAMHENT